jgi:hypothetical protein
VRHTLLCLAVAAGIPFTATAAMAVPGPAGAATATASAAAVTAAQPAAAPQQLLLMNGDRAQVRTGADGQVNGGLVRPAGSGLAGSAMSLALGGHRYEIPFAALPYLGRGLDPRLFDLGALLAEEKDGRLPVRVGYARAVPLLPGVTITRSGGGVAAGYLTASSAKVFAAALDRQFAADHARGSYGTDGMFAGGVSLTLAGGGPEPVVRPAYQLHTLTVTGTNLAGKPDTGDLVLLMNVDNTNLFNPGMNLGVGAGRNFFYKGETKFSVPAGHYFAFGLFAFPFSRSQALLHVVVLPQFTVAGDSTTVAMAARAATSKITMVTPRAATPLATGFGLVRAGARGPLFSLDFSTRGTPLWVSPTTARPTVGTLGSFANQVLVAPKGHRGVPYSYELSYPGPSGYIPRQRYQVRPADLATVHERFYQSFESSGTWEMLGGFTKAPASNPFIGFVDPADIEQKAPGRRTVYVGGAGAGPMAWGSQYSETVGFINSGAETFREGSQVTDNWGAYPLHPAPNTELHPLQKQRFGFTQVSAARESNTLWVDVTPFSDNQAGHLSSGLLPRKGIKFTGNYAIFQNGRQVAGGAVGFVPLQGLAVQMRAPLSRAPATVRVVLHTARTGSQAGFATASRTVWAWRSTYQPRATLPGSWTCHAPEKQEGFRFTSHCAIQPMMTLAYHLAKLGLNETAPPGRQVLGVSVGHIQLVKAIRITRATVRVSFDGGKKWHDAAVRNLGRGRYHAIYNAPAGSDVMLRVSAKDAAGGRITETITHAYRVGGSGSRSLVGASRPAMASGAAALSSGAVSSPALSSPARSSGVPTSRAACPAVRAGRARCLVEFLTRPGVSQELAGPSAALAAAAPSGWGAKSIESAYKLPVSQGSGQIVAVVDAFNTPGLAGYMNTYRAQYGLPACTISSGCLREVNQKGQASPLPASGARTGWDLETTLDVDMVSAACPRCKILLVEANDDALPSLAAAEDTAARLGAQVISNSYGAREGGYPMTLTSAYDHPGHTIVVSSGDSGFTAASFPANLASVTAVGGTVLARASNARGWREKVWNLDGGAGGSGCSAYVTKPAWQTGTACRMRTTADVSAVAWNVAIYNKLWGGWLAVGGTSAAAPLVAGVYALAGNATTIHPSYPYLHRAALFDVTTGNNDLIEGSGGAVCGYTYLCVAKKGYDAPTGLGTPDGTGSF